ncbi:MAG: hypothetical protein ACRC14_17185, partial [Paracoccaceae bacterium]
MGQIENVIADLENVEDKYHHNWVLPYASAYVAAHTRFKETLDAQKERDKMMVQLFLTAATIGFGAGMGAMFGKTALNAIVVDQALNVVCNRNMTRTFNTMASISASVPGTFIAGQGWDAISAGLSEHVKSKVTGMVTGSPASAAAISEPQIMQNDLLQYVLKIKTATHDVCAHIRDKASSQAVKDNFAGFIRLGPFMQDAPQNNIVGDPQRASDILELGFYMVLVMNSDYLVEYTTSTQGPDTSGFKHRLGAVTVPTTDVTYRSGVKALQVNRRSGFTETS